MVSVLASVLAVACVVRGMLVMLDSRQRVVQHLVEQEQLYQQLRPEVRRLREHQAALEQRLRDLDRITLVQGRAEAAFQRIAQALPDTAWLTTAILTKTTALEGTLEGRARSFQGVTELMERLKSAGWETVKPLSTTVVTDAVTGAEQMLGSRGIAIDWKAGRGHVRVFGEVWSARGEMTLKSGDAVRVTARDGLTLTVEPE